MLALTALLLAPPPHFAPELDSALTSALIATAPPAADRPGFSYTYVEANYARLDSDAASDKIDGLELTGSLGLPLNFFVQATSSTLNGDADLQEWRLGAGWHFSLGSTIDAFGLLSYVDQNFNSGISDESGVTGDAGVRLAVTPKIEVSGYGEWADVEKSEVGFGAGARYYLTERLSLGVRALFIDTGDQWVGGLRFQF